MLLIVLPCYCMAQDHMVGKLSEFRVDDETKDTIIRSYWQVLERSSMVHKLNTFYRISRINGDMFIDLKAVEGGELFVVPRGALVKLLLENGDVIVLRNEKYTVSCPGCGDRGYWGGQAHGVQLRFPLPDDDIRLMLRYHIMAIVVGSSDDYLEKRVSQSHADIFMSELRHVYRARY